MFQDVLSSFWIHGVKIAAIVIGVIIVQRFLNAFIGRAINRLIQVELDGEAKRKRAETLVSVVTGIFRFSISIFAFIMILAELGLNVAPILAGVGMFGLAVGMAAKSVISDFIAGLFILLEDQYSVGDKVQIAGLDGVVKNLTLRRTILQSEDGKTHSVPNSQIKTVTKEGQS